MNDKEKHVVFEQAIALPREFDFSPIQEFTETFGKDLAAPLPSPWRIEVWRHGPGELEWQQRCRDSKIAHKKHRRYLLSIEAENEQIAGLNKARLVTYEKACNTHSELVRRHAEQFCGSARTRLEDTLRSQLRDTIAAQQPIIASILRDIACRAALKTCESKGFALWLLLLFLYAVTFVMYPMFVFLPGAAAFIVWQYILHCHYEQVQQWRRDAAGPSYEDARSHHQSRWTFYLVDMDDRTPAPNTVRTPVFVGTMRSDGTGHRECESCPFAGLGNEDGSHPHFLLLLIVSCLPGLSLALIAGCLFQFLGRVLFPSVRSDAQRVTLRRQATLMNTFDNHLTNPNVIEYLERRHHIPQAPEPPLLIQPKCLPLAPPAPVRPDPPADCYDDAQCGDYSRTIKGTTVYTASELRIPAVYSVFADNKARPYVVFGDLPSRIIDRQSTNYLFMGTGGSGKTTLLRSLMSALLPLTRAQFDRILQRSPDPHLRMPSSSHEWSRSVTHQAVVYNAKNENVPFLVELGFNTDTNLYILDSADIRCYAIDLAKDVNDRETIAQFANCLVPMRPSAGKKSPDDIWDEQARRLIEATIISIRNAAFADRQVPEWTLNDLVMAFTSPETLAGVLKYHDMPEAVLAQLINLHDGQASSIYMTASAHIAKFAITASRWEEARRRGRVISLKDWAKNGAHSVIVLPNTQSNEAVNGPLNQALMKLLVNLFLQEENSAYLDHDGHVRSLRRFIVIDEVGQAGALASELNRGLFEGRDFGLMFALGVHQLSQLRDTVGRNSADSILGLCGNLALLKTGDPTTAEWMSKRIGQHLREYPRTSFNYGVTKGKTYTITGSSAVTRTEGAQLSQTTGRTQGFSDARGTSLSTSQQRGGPSIFGTHRTRTDNHSQSDSQTFGASQQLSNSSTESISEADSNTESNGQAETTELRLEAAVLPSEFTKLPDPASTDCVTGYFITPSMPPWRAEISFEALAPRLECPSASKGVPRRLLWSNDEEVSRPKPWTPADYKRLAMQPPELPNNSSPRKPDKNPRSKEDEPHRRADSHHPPKRRKTDPSHKPSSDFDW